jgi:hypothetical protein
MWINPLTYGMAILRRCLYLTQPAAAGVVPPLLPSLAVMVLFGAMTLSAAVYTAHRGSIV